MPEPPSSQADLLARTAQHMEKLAEQLRGDGEGLLARAAALEEAITQLWANAEELGIVEQPDPEREPTGEGPGDKTRSGEQVGMKDCLDAARELGRFTRAQFEEKLFIKPVVASRWLTKMREGGLVERDDSGDQTMFGFIGAPAPAPREDITPEKYSPSEPEEEGDELTLEMLRDAVAAHGDEPFSPHVLAHENEWPLDDTLEGIQTLVEREVIEDISPTPDMALFKWIKPTEPGAGFERDMERRRKGLMDGGEEALTRNGSTAVAGTGKQQRSNNKDVQAFIAELRSQGCEVGMAAGATHWEVIKEGVGRTLISGTPRSGRTVKNERARLKRDKYLV